MMYPCDMVVLRCIAYTLAGLILSGAMALAQQYGRDTLRTDSIRIYRSADVIVSANSILPRVSRDAQPLAVIAREEIHAANAIDISDVVGFAPGVFVKQYGGLGGLRTLSLRGTSAQQAVILIDGVRYRTSADGAFDLSNIPAATVERIEVVRGGNTALYGAGAVGGVVNLVTRSSGPRPLQAAMSGTVGSFGERRFTLDADAASGSHDWKIGLSSTVAGGDYPFTFDEYGETRTLRRENADFTNFFGHAGWAYRGDEGDALSLTLQGFQSDRGTPGAVVQGNREQLRARLTERDLFATARYTHPLGEWQLSALAGGRLNGLRYRDPDARLAGPSGLDNHYAGRDISLAFRARKMMGSDGTLDLAGEFSYAGVEGDNLDPSAGASVRRLQWSGIAGTNWFLEDGILGWETGFDAALRADLFSDIGGAVSPSAGLNLRIGATPLRARAHAGLSYRAPTFVEQYYLNYGNRDLRPERGISLSTGLTYEPIETIVLESGFFLMKTTDQIIAVPRSPVSWSAANIADVLSRGVELALAGTMLDGRLMARLSYTLMRAEDRTEGMTYGKLLVYAPQELFNGILNMRFGWLATSVNWQYVSHRFTLPMNNAESALPHYSVVGAGISAGWKLGLLGCTGRLECTNILDAGYYVVRNYPMPGRTVRAEILVKFGGAKTP